MSNDFRHSATLAEVMAVANLTSEFAQAWSGQLALTHVAEVAYHPNINPDEGVVGSDIRRIARELRIELSNESVIGQQYVLAPTNLGGVALWRQRPGSVHTPNHVRRTRVFKADALC